jgi:hypothetical protein
VVGCDTAGRKPGVVFVFARGTSTAGGTKQEQWWQTQRLSIGDSHSSITDGCAADCTAAPTVRSNPLGATLTVRMAFNSFGASLTVRGASLLVGAGGLGAVYFYR